MVTDLGGFAAACFKRGIRFINIPTTLLGAVDAAVGGKTGINFNGLKNEIGAFRPADTVIVSTQFFQTLPQNELLSGYAEMLKHGLIDNPATYRSLLDFDLSMPDWEKLLPLLKESIQVKERIVAEDPFEKGSLEFRSYHRPCIREPFTQAGNSHTSRIRRGLGTHMRITTLPPLSEISVRNNLRIGSIHLSPLQSISHYL